MRLLDDLASVLSEQTTMTVRDAVLLVSSEDGLPRARLSKSGVSRHALFLAPAGLFFCDLHASAPPLFFAEIGDGTIEVGEPERLDPKQDLVLENNWPSTKIEIGDRYYAVPRNFGSRIESLLAAHKKQTKKRR